MLRAATQRWLPSKTSRDFGSEEPVTRRCGEVDESGEAFRPGLRWPIGMKAAPNATKALKAATLATVDPCDVCAGPTYEQNCKVICRRCGYTRDCSDP